MGYIWINKGMDPRRKVARILQSKKKVRWVNGTVDPTPKTHKTTTKRLLGTCDYSAARYMRRLMKKRAYHRRCAKKVSVSDVPGQA